ncbi:MAG: hypothetical protein AMK73_08840 [Planctomycetes bacterium SM23_32]|nr:MAG: hypothetical protein AMK73_08840 [Planctomycetes bacterium SM23_32]
MSAESPRGSVRSRGRIYRCPVCGAELAVLVAGAGRLSPRCCNVDMVPTDRRLAFYVCMVCGAEVALLRRAGGRLSLRCCNEDMVPQAA